MVKEQFMLRCLSYINGMMAVRVFRTFHAQERSLNVAEYDEKRQKRLEPGTISGVSVVIKDEHFFFCNKN